MSERENPYKLMADDMRAALAAMHNLHAEIHKMQSDLIRIKTAAGSIAPGSYRQPPLETINTACGALAFAQEYFEKRASQLVVAET